MAPGLIQALLLAAAGLTAAVPATAATPCYRADAGDGELLFDGVLDGTPFTGSFNRFTVSLCLEGDDLAGADIRVSVDTASGDTGNRQGNAALRGEEFFHIARFPEAVWTSLAIRPDGDSYLAEGELAVRGISAAQPVRLRFEPGEPARLSGSAQILRLDWDVGTGEFADTDFLRNRVDLRFDLTLRKQGGD
jgi:polyisoprenoid-binding protein YceI